MALEIYESKNFTVKGAEKPHIDRSDGGHIVIIPKQRIASRQELSPKQAIELMRLTIVTGETMKTVMNKHGVDIGIINYQDNGNWSVFKPKGPYLHIHLYGRAKTANIQSYGQTLNQPHKDEHPEFYKNLKPLTNQDINEMKKELERLLIEEKYSNKNWTLL